VLARQHVWLGPEATRFTAPCEACLARREPDLWGLSIASARVEGELRLDADVGFITCARGHRVVVRRIGVDTRKRRRAERKAERKARYALT
jgi:hypothetical protein